MSAPAVCATPAPDHPPASDVSAGVGLVGLAVLVLWIALCRHWGWVVAVLDLPGPRAPLAGPFAALAGLGLSAAAMMAWSLWVDGVHRRPSTGIDWANPRPWGAHWHESAIKLFGLWATWGIIALFYGLCRWYWQGPWLFAMQVMGVLALPLALVSVPYVLWLDRVLVQPRDGAWHFGAWLAGRRDADVGAILIHWRAWAVKGFFTAFMLSIVPGGFAHVVRFDWAQSGDPAALANWLIDLLFVVDVQIGTVGYVLTLRPLDAHIRSANPYLDGWLAALVCYPPFVLMSAGGPLDYQQGGMEWSGWIAGHPALLWGWGAVLVCLTACYAWATVAFGVRFSNLTYRGVITTGPYRWTRHPAYLAKNLFWWGASLPMLPATGLVSDALRNTAILASVSAVYWWRARTEERHLLAQDAKYREYHAWAGAHAPVTRGIGAVLRWLGFTAGR
ncbi:DUF1295 domain-containing protein [Novosphingobium sp. FSY-8]|uniref:DUF1295 domain-containing protein n=2 Tax=Novosphingobium ovatum TaxID=1908523 RepID=A0ABW9XBC8_9SPHN|nr:DUF1295 domain-containing protein [Novosphingobium ovatum]